MLGFMFHKKFWLILCVTTLVIIFIVFNIYSITPINSASAINFTSIINFTTSTTTSRTTTINSTTTIKHSTTIKKSLIYCFRILEDTLPDISQLHIRKGKSIFFHETSCRSYENGKITILPRQACAVESAARMNPNFDIYLTFSSPGVFKFEKTESDRMLQSLLKYKNVKIIHLNYENYFKNTPVEELYSKGKIERGIYAMQHASDVLRYLTLYKYGGIYLDTDVVVIKSLEELEPNYAGIESSVTVAAGVINFDHKSIGHDHVLSILIDLKHNFNENAYSDSGPIVITRMARKLCGIQLAGEMIDKSCQNFTVYPEYMFYPIPYQNWRKYFNPNNTKEVFKKTNDSYAIHVWNKLSSKTKVPNGTLNAYTMIAQQYCPTIYKESDTF